MESSLAEYYVVKILYKMQKRLNSISIDFSLLNLFKFVTIICTVKETITTEAEIINP